MFNNFRTLLGNREAVIVNGLKNYSLSDTLECGQVFRFEKVSLTDDDCGLISEYIINALGRIIDVGQRNFDELIFFGITDEELPKVAKYFDLYTDREKIKADILSHTDSAWLAEAAECAGGIAILRQEPWEMLVSFIISQNNNIPRIKKILRSVCSEYGVNLTLHGKTPEKCPLSKTSGTPCEEFCKNCGVCYSFPTAEDILARPEGLLPSKPGFRYSYLIDAAEKVASGEVSLEKIAAARSYTHTLECLTKIRGVGAKVASCVALFGFANLEAFPIDVWMRRAIDTYFDGNLDPASLGRYAGVAQQYIFHYIRNLSSSEG